jgi:hypothetical protein
MPIPRFRFRGQSRRHKSRKVAKGRGRSQNQERRCPGAATHVLKVDMIGKNLDKRYRFLHVFKHIQMFKTFVDVSSLTYPICISFSFYTWVFSRFFMFLCNITHNDTSLAPICVHIRATAWHLALKYCFAIAEWMSDEQCVC